VVRKRGWLTREQFLDLLGAANLIPGPSSTEMAIYIGLVRAGCRGLIVAGTCFILPAMVIVLALAVAYVEYGTLPQVVFSPSFEPTWMASRSPWDSLPRLRSSRCESTPPGWSSAAGWSGWLSRCLAETRQRRTGWSICPKEQAFSTFFWRAYVFPFPARGSFLY